MNLWEEIKRRRVWQVALIYLAGAFALAQVAQFLLESYEAPAWVIQLIIALLAAGFPFSLALAWFFDLTPHGLERTEEKDEGAGEAAEQIDVPKPVLNLPPEDDKSIAVLPFVNMSDDDSNEYFADGISEELLNLLAKIGDLRVISRSSAFAFKGKDLDMKDVASKLHVANLLEGSVRKSGNKVRVTAQLIRAHSDAHLWSETWDRDLDDIFKVQDEIAEAVVKELKVHLLGEMPTVEEIDPSTYALYLQAYHMSQKIETMDASMVLCEDVLRKEPMYLPALLCQARNKSNQSYRGTASFEEADRQAREVLDRMLEIDPDHPEALSFMATLEGQDPTGDMKRAVALIKRAYENAPRSSMVLRHLADLLENIGEIEKSSRAYRWAMAVDPVNPMSYGTAAAHEAMVGNRDLAIKYGEAALSIMPERPGSHYSMSFAHAVAGDYEVALETLSGESDEGWVRIGDALFNWLAGNTEEADAALAKVIEMDEEEASFDIAYIYATRGEINKGYEWLDKAVEYKDGGLSYVLTHPFLANLRSDPRWPDFLQKVGRAPEQIAQIDLDIDLPEPPTVPLPQGGTV